MDCTQINAYKIALKATVSIALLTAVVMAGATDGSAQVFDLDRIPTISDVPFGFVGTWDWRTGRQSCGSRTDSYGNPLLFGGGLWFEIDARHLVEGDDADSVAFVELVDERLKSLLDELESSASTHGAGGVDDEYQGAGLAVVLIDHASFESDS